MQIHNIVVFVAIAAMTLAHTVSGSTIIVTMEEKHDMIKIYEEIYMDNAAKGRTITAIKEKLVDHARDSQKYVLRELAKHADVQYRSIWMSNQVIVYNASPALTNTLSKTRHVLQVRPEEVLPLPSHFEPVREITQNATQTAFLDIKLNEAWQQGFTGQDVVVGSISTGVRYAHKSLRSNYQQNGGWYDPVDRTLLPNDFHGIGTHTTGIMVSHDTGIAPKAHWMACKGCQGDGCHESHLLECMQFMICPTNTNGENPDCHKGASVVHNGWVGASTQSTFFRHVFSLLNYVSITPVFAAGDKGPECSSIGKIESISSVYTVGAADHFKLTPFSNRGKPNVDSYDVKPNVIAPGVNIITLSHDKDQGYVYVTGTQASSAVAAGSLLLLLSQRPSLSSGDVRNMFMLTSVYLKDDEGNAVGDFGCGPTRDAGNTGFPNADMGWGNIDLVPALDVLKIKSKVKDCRTLGREECIARSSDCDWYWGEYVCQWKDYKPPFTLYCNALNKKMCLEYSTLCYFEAYNQYCYPVKS